jgi:glycosyltransferase involved in cell wall biosynthesis
MSPAVDTAIVITTYNNPTALRKTLLGLIVQSDRSFSVIIADDGSDESLTEAWSGPLFKDLPLHRIWQPHAGFGAAQIRNRAIAETTAPYLVFMDADCIPRNDFIANHRRFRKERTYLSGHRLELPESIHLQLTDEDILENRIFDVNYLRQFDPQLAHYRWRLSRSPTAQRIRDLLGWRPRVFCSSNASAWRSDILKVNGFDEGMKGYGSEDRDLGARLCNAGIASRYFKCSLSMLHQSHRRSYVDPAQQQLNRRVFKRRLRNGETWIPNGVVKGTG